MKINVEIPNSLADITLRQYKHYLKIQKNVEDEKFLGAKIIEIFCNIKLEEVMRLKFSDSELITNNLVKMFDEKPKLLRHFKLGKTQYGFHPKLDDLTLGEYIDLDTFIGDWDNIEKAMNVLYRPIDQKIKDKYTIKKYDTNDFDTMLDMPMDAVISSIFFFWSLGLELSKTITNSLEMEGEGQALTHYLTSLQNGVGITQFTASLKETLQSMKISLS
tara:strand:+ start:6397 stop:7050 length:654 start_codon:yes stop_codon:yes gene_type:complete